MSKRVFYSDEENPYDYSPKASTKSEYRDVEKSVPDGFVAPLKDKETVPPNFTGQQVGWGTINKNLGAPQQRSTDGATFGKNIDDTEFLEIDEEGKIKVKSLAREDFHYFSPIESLDNFQIAITGTGTITLGPGSVIFLTENVNTKKNSLIKTFGGGLNWDKDRKLKVYLAIDQDTAQKVYILSGSNSTPSMNVRHIGFYIEDNTIYGTVADGTTQSTVNLGSVSTSGQALEVVFTAGVSAKFYKDGVYLNEITTNLPSGETAAALALNAAIQTTENVDKRMYIYWYDFWQAN